MPSDRPSLEDAARRLNDAPFGQDLEDAFARKMAEGVNVKPVLKRLNEKTIEVGSIMDQLGFLSDTLQKLNETVGKEDDEYKQVEAKIDDLNRRAATSQDEIQNIASKAPEAINMQQQQWQGLRRDEIREEFSGLDNQLLADRFGEEIPKTDSKFDIYRQMDTPEKMLGSMKESLIANRLSPQNMTPYDFFSPLQQSESSAFRIKSTPLENQQSETPNVEPPIENIKSSVSDDNATHVIVDDILDSKATYKTNIIGGMVGGQGSQNQSGENNKEQIGKYDPEAIFAGGKFTPDEENVPPQEESKESKVNQPKNSLKDNDLGRGFGTEHILGAGKVLNDLSTPGGASLGRTGQGLMGSALSGAGFMGILGLPGILAGAGISMAGSQVMGQAEQMRNIEGQFGEDQGLFGRFGGGQELRGAQIEARLTHPLMGSDEISALTDELANLGATAEEAASALGPAADALGQYKILTEETAARAARRGEQSSEIGGSEASVLGSVMEQLAGGGFSAGAINEAAQKSADTFEPMGVAQGEYAGLGLTNLFSSGGQRTDMALEQSGTAVSGIETAGRILNDPLVTGQVANMYNGGGAVDYTKLDANSVEGRTQAAYAETRAVWQMGQPYLSQLERDDKGEINISGGENSRIAEMISMQVQPLTGREMQPSEVLSMLSTVEKKGGDEKAYESTLAPEQAAEKDRKRIDREIGGSLQEEAQKETGKQAGADIMANFGGDALTIPGVGGVPLVGAPLAGVANKAAKLFTGKSAIQRGEAGSMEAARAWKRTEGGSLGTLLGTEGEGLFDKGINPHQVTVTGEKGKEFTLDEVSKSKKLKKRFEAGELTSQVDVGGKTQKMTGKEMAKAAYNDELKFDTGFLGIGKNKLKMRGEEAGKGGKVQVEFTGTAEKFFKQSDPKDPGTMAGANNQANSNQSVGKGKTESYDKKPLWG